MLGDGAWVGEGNDKAALAAAGCGILDPDRND